MLFRVEIQPRDPETRTACKEAHSERPGSSASTQDEIILGRMSSESMSKEPSDRMQLLQGTLDMLVLKSLQLGPMHGWGITERLEVGSERVLQVGQGSLYPALYRLERQGFIASEWGTTENNRQARFYKLTTAGRKRLAEERASWVRLSRAVELVLQMGEG